MKRILLLVVVLLPGAAIFALPGVLYGHGVGYRRSSQNPVALEFFYSTGETMAYQEARVFSPRDSDAAFQTGRTDGFGRLAFVPDVSGDWRAVVSDIEGHRAEARIEVGGEFFTGGNVASPQAGSFLPGGTELAIRALLGVSVIINIAVLSMLYGNRKGQSKCT
jgi:nickel transport protein